MSKAFVKDEGEGSESVDLEVDPLSALPAGSKNYMTLSGYQKLHARIAELSAPMRRALDLAEPVDPKTQRGDKVLFGATVTVEDSKGQIHVYRIVGITEADAGLGKISWLSPIARALLQKEEGEIAVVKTPHGDEELEILKIEFIEID